MIAPRRHEKRYARRHPKRFAGLTAHCGKVVSRRLVRRRVARRRHLIARAAPETTRTPIRANSSRYSDHGEPASHDCKDGPRRWCRMRICDVRRQTRSARLVQQAPRSDTLASATPSDSSEAPNARIDKLRYLTAHRPASSSAHSRRYPRSTGHGRLLCTPPTQSAWIAKPPPKTPTAPKAAPT